MKLSGKTNTVSTLNADTFTAEGWHHVNDRLPAQGQHVEAIYPGVYDTPREVCFYRDGVNTHFGKPNEPDGKGSQPALYWRPLVTLSVRVSRSLRGLMAKAGDNAGLSMMDWITKALRETVRIESLPRCHAGNENVTFADPKPGAEFYYGPPGKWDALTVVKCEHFPEFVQVHFYWNLSGLSGVMPLEIFRRTFGRDRNEAAFNYRKMQILMDSPNV